MPTHTKAELAKRAAKKKKVAAIMLKSTRKKDKQKRIRKANA